MIGHDQMNITIIVLSFGIQVVYNCRCMSDMLFNQYDVLLDNVFDIQVYA